MPFRKYGTPIHTFSNYVAHPHSLLSDYMTHLDKQDIVVLKSVVYKSLNSEHFIDTTFTLFFPQYKQATLKIK